RGPSIHGLGLGPVLRLLRHQRLYDADNDVLADAGDGCEGGTSKLTGAPIEGRQFAVGVELRGPQVLLVDFALHGLEPLGTAHERPGPLLVDVLTLEVVVIG